MKRIRFAAGCLIASVVAATASTAATPADRAFVAKVSQGGMFEVASAEVAASRGSTQDVRDFAAMEIHDHHLVGDKLGMISGHEGIAFAKTPNAEFQAKLDRLKTLSGLAFDAAYMKEMAELHAADGAAFAKESHDGGSADYRSFGTETHRIVQRHIGAIHAVEIPAR